MLHLRAEGRTQSFSLSSSVKSLLARTKAGSARRAAFLNVEDLPDDEEDEGEGCFGKVVDLLAAWSVFVGVKIGVGLITFTALIFCILDVDADFISF